LKKLQAYQRKRYSSGVFAKQYLLASSIQVKNNFMAPKKANPFYTELGNILNLIRRLSIELTHEAENNKTVKGEVHNMWYARDLSFSKLQGNLQQLESEIEYFFTENGCRKAIDKTFNTQTIKQKFQQTFNSLTNEYFSIKTNEATQATEEPNNTSNVQRDLPISLLN
jgi:hypothetical protein